MPEVGLVPFAQLALEVAAAVLRPSELHQKQATKKFHLTTFWKPMVAYRA